MTVHYLHVLYVMHLIFVWAQCWSKTMVVLGTLWNTSANVYLKLNVIIQLQIGNLWQLDLP